MPQAVDGVSTLKEGGIQPVSEMVQGRPAVRLTVERPPRSVYKHIASKEHDPQSSAYEWAGDESPTDHDPSINFSSLSESPVHHGGQAVQWG